MSEVRLTRAEFNSLLEYSCSLPTGTRIGKKWRRRVPYVHNPRITPQWYQGEYVPCAELGPRGEPQVGIEWSEIVIVDDPLLCGGGGTGPKE